MQSVKNVRNFFGDICGKPFTMLLNSHYVLLLLIYELPVAFNIHNNLWFLKDMRFNIYQESCYLKKYFQVIKMWKLLHHM